MISDTPDVIYDKLVRFYGAGDRQAAAGYLKSYLQLPLPQKFVFASNLLTSACQLSRHNHPEIRLRVADIVVEAANFFRDIRNDDTDCTEQTSLPVTRTAEDIMDYLRPAPPEALYFAVEILRRAPNDIRYYVTENPLHDAIGKKFEDILNSLGRRFIRAAKDYTLASPVPSPMARYAEALVQCAMDAPLSMDIFVASYKRTQAKVGSPAALFLGACVASRLPRNLRLAKTASDDFLMLLKVNLPHVPPINGIGDILKDVRKQQINPRFVEKFESLMARRPLAWLPPPNEKPPWWIQRHRPPGRLRSSFYAAIIHRRISKTPVL